MKTPFVFGRIATGDNFTDRVHETKHLVQNFTSLINTIIISPRRWGKSSLVHKAAKEAIKADPQLRICEIDLFNIRTEKDFYRALAEGVIKACATKWDDVKNATLMFLTNILPKLVISSDPGIDFTLDLDWERTKDNVDEVLDLAEKIAEEKDLKIMVCIDEFQNISYFADPLFLQKRLRAHWQRHQRVGYCLFGSKRHMMLNVFTASGSPFYKFGDLIFLNKISPEYLMEFISKRFSETGKEIDEEAGLTIVELVECHPYYTQQLAQLAWLRTSDRCDVSIVRNAHEALVEQLSLLFATIVQPLKTSQMAYLHAVIDGVTTITSTQSLQRYGFSSATAALRAKKSLIELDIIDDVAGTVQLQDPTFAYWLKHTYFK